MGLPRSVMLAMGRRVLSGRWAAVIAAGRGAVKRYGARASSGSGGGMERGGARLPEEDDGEDLVHGGDQGDL